MEQWRDIEGYEGLYQVSNLGRVKSLERTIKRAKVGNTQVREKILTQRDSGSGYMQVTLCKNGTKKYPLVHRLVAAAFVPNEEGLSEINHKNENSHDNRAVNLEWCTHSQNINHGTRNKKVREKMVNRQSMSKPVSMLQDGVVLREFPSIMEVQRSLGFNNALICQCCKGRVPRAYGFEWKYKD